MCGGIIRPASALFFPCEAECECEATRPGEVPKGRPAASPASTGGAVAEPAGEPTRGGGWTGHASTSRGLDRGSRP